MKILAVLVALVVLCPTLSRADDLRLDGDEIAALLSGNTALGEWRGTPTRQYFDPSGRTSYLEEGAAPTQGLWRADAAMGLYCSQWPPSGTWSCYAIERDPDLGEGHFVWTQEGSDYRSPFTMRDGKDLTF